MRKELLAVRRDEMDGVLISAGRFRLPGNWETMVHHAQELRDWDRENPCPTFKDYLIGTRVPHEMRVAA